VAASTGESQSAVGRDQTAYVGFYGLWFCRAWACYYGAFY